MDFKRVSIIFLITFFVLNIFLGTTYIQGKRSQKLSDLGDLAQIEERLAEENIKYSGTLSTKSKEAYYLSGISSDLAALAVKEISSVIENDPEGKSITRDLSTVEHLSFSDEDLIERTSRFLKSDNGIAFGEDYTYRKKLTGKTPALYFTQEYQGIPFYDDGGAVTVNYEKIKSPTPTYQLSSLTQTHIANIEQLREKQTVISEQEAIATLYVNSKLPERSKIGERVLAYTHIFSVDEKNIYLPVWFVWVNTGTDKVQIEKVNAFSNTIITTNVSDVTAN
ncbi:two-component system regulatory protein YycI [Vagococcus xieshaowenii]|uniref:Regulatory protein YycH-like domain-containing protein n=1 Tax=Vagococcus xieshaowenii TaxID=2562451 RepID=A0AAJ5EF08_9ENTE|nr:two-component system regulatory protein YycI [Vagococcus xieshaowenii]QCA27874.1 hypothetical protein E4Z98_00320 [Vagococcus xieshaowenii]TFZ39447.1 hypothetical protein E4031_09070 [Vagococcus xieshaowenii]